MPATKPPSLEVLAKYPKMTPWFHPGLLARLLGRVIVSDMFGQYADRRLIVAALDTVDDNELVNRAQQFMSDTKNERDAEGAIWIDFVADLGDGFDSTYAIASLLARESLEVDGHPTRRGQILILGGDQVYPNASAKNYQERLRDPYGWAFPDPDPDTDRTKSPPVYAIPGNHDWYDGLVVFLALFARKEELHLGGWRSHQRRSYFALQVTEKWWIWAMDAQLYDDLDQPQREYFEAIAKAMPDDANIILCGPEPGWLYTATKEKSLGVIDYVGWRALNRSESMNIPLVLSGDTHHYSRYEGKDRDTGLMTQFITSGGGGAFLHPTHALAPTIDLQKIPWLRGRVTMLTLARDPNLKGEKAKEALYPTREKSLSLLARDFAFAAYNPGFALVLGVCYWLLGLVAVHLEPDGNYIVFSILLAGFWAYTRKQEGDSWKVFRLSFANAIVHGAAVIFLAKFFSGFNAAHVSSEHWPRFSFLLFGGEMVFVGGLIAGTLFGIYLYISSRCFNLNHNDAFSALRLDSHRHFLRMRIKGDEVTIYPIGLDRVPKRDEWLDTREKDNGLPPQEYSPVPIYVPNPPLKWHLIEGPIVVRVPPRDKNPQPKRKS